MRDFGNTVWNATEKAALDFLELLFRIAGKELTDEKKTVFMQFVKFGIVGVSNTVISYVLYAAILIVMRKAALFESVDYLIAQIMAFVLSVLWSFYWNNKLVFTLEEGRKRSVWKALFKTYISYSFTGLFLNSVLLVLWVRVCGISEFIAPIINLIISVPVNFLMNKLWAFRAE